MLPLWIKLFLLVYISSLGALALQSVLFDLDYFQVSVFSYFERQGTSTSNVEGLLQPQQDLLLAFRIRYCRFERAIQEALVNTTDSTVLARLGDDLDEFTNLVTEVYLKSFLYFEDYMFMIFSYRMQMFLKPLSYQHFATTSGQCRWIYVYNMRRLWTCRTMGIQQWSKQSTLAAGVDLLYLSIQTFCDGHMLTEVHLELHDSYMLVDGLSEMPW